MPAKPFIESAVAEFQKAKEHLRLELSKLQIGRAQASLVEDVKIEAYGTTQPLKSIAGISIPDAKTIQIQAWDRGIMPHIEKGIMAANLGLNPINDGHNIRISLPPLNEERRKELTKVVHTMAENAKIAVRNVRGKAHQAFKDLEKAKKISEDEQRLAEKHLQEKVDMVNKEIEEAAKKKEQEIMTI